jgi:hypothetical protein
MLTNMQELAARLGPVLGAIFHAPLVVIAVVAGFFGGIAVRQLLFLVWVDRGRSFAIGLVRLVAALVFGGTAALLVAALGSGQKWDGSAVLGAITGAATVLIEPVLLGLRQLRPGRPPLLGWLLRTVLVLLALLLAALLLGRAGYLALTTDHPVLLIEVTGETATKTVRWAPPDQPLREQELRQSRVLLRTPTGQLVAEAWIYGDQVAINGRVLRLSPLLNAAGLTNLFALDFVHNGYTTAERHNTMPHQAQPLLPLGQLAVHPRWRELQDRLLALWERRSDADGNWAIRAATTESTYFPLVAPTGKPLQRTYTLVLTPGGLTAK